MTDKELEIKRLRDKARKILDDNVLPNNSTITTVQKVPILAWNEAMWLLDQAEALNTDK